MNVIFVGVQGSGKGTQAKVIAEKMGLCHISVGDLFRDLVKNGEGELKEELQRIMNEGELVDDKLTIKIVKKRIEKTDCKKGVILDGFPRNLEQAKLLDFVISIDKVVEIKISDEESLKRLSGRVGCKDCGAGYNVYTAPKPLKEGVCDKCGGKLVRRVDDNEESIKKRIQTYHDETEPILDFYSGKVIEVDGERKIEEISEDILGKLK